MPVIVNSIKALLSSGEIENAAEFNGSANPGAKAILKKQMPAKVKRVALEGCVQVVCLWRVLYKPEFRHTKM